MRRWVVGDLVVTVALALALVVAFAATMDALVPSADELMDTLSQLSGHVGANDYKHVRAH